MIKKHTATVFSLLALIIFSIAFFLSIFQDNFNNSIYAMFGIILTTLFDLNRRKQFLQVQTKTVLDSEQVGYIIVKELLSYLEKPTPKK